MEFLKTHKKILVLLIVLSIPALFPLFRPGFFQSDDAEWMIIRFSAFHQALRDGQLPVRFLHRLNFGYGYPVADFLYPGFMYLGEILKIVGFGFVAVIKITLGISLLESVIFTYFWLARIFSKWPAVIGSLFYLYAPYHLFDVYKRGSVGEVLALATVPFILWQIERKSLFWTSLGIALLILAHNTLTLLFIPIIFFYGYLRQKDLLFVISYLLFGFCLSAFFWVPALYDLQFTIFNSTKVSIWENYFSGVNLIGLSTIFILIISAATFLQKNKRSIPKTFIYFFILAIGSLFFATQASELVWKLLPVSFVQFPFRFLSITILSVSFLCAFLLSQFPKKTSLILSGAIIIMLIINAKPFIWSLLYFDKGDAFYSTNEATTTVQDEYMPGWVKEKPVRHFTNKVEIKSGSGIVSDVSWNGKRVSAKVLAKEDIIVVVNTIYFPGWNVYLNGKKTTIFYNNKMGVIEVSVASGNYNLEAVFEETPLRLASDAVTIGSFIGLLFYVIRNKRRSV